MGQLNNLYVSSSFQGLLKMTDSTSGLTSTLQTVQGGDGSNSPLQMSLTQVNISGSFTVNGSPISIDTGSFATTGSNTFNGNQLINGGFVINSGLNNFQVDNVGNAFIKSNGANPFILEGLGSIDNNSISFPTTLNISSSVKVSGSLSVEGDTTFKGNLIPSGNFVYDLGSVTNQWRSLFVGSGSIYMDDHKILGLDPNNSDLQIFAPTGTSIQMIDYTKSNSGLEVTSSFKVNFTGNTGNPLVDISDITYDLFPNQHIDLRLLTQGSGDIILDAGGVNPRNDVAVNGRIIQYEPGSTPNSLKDTNITGSLRSSNIIGTGSLFLQPDQSDVRYVEIYNTSPTDTHITASGGQIFLGDDVTYVKVDNYGSVKHIDIVADNGVNISGSVQITGSLDITGNITATSASFTYLETIYETASVIYSSGSNQLGDELSDIQILSGSVQVQGELLVNGVAVVTGSVNRDGLITTGSIGTSQSITGSLVEMGGNMYYAHSGQTIPFNITSSLGSTNTIYGWDGKSTQELLTGSVEISGSNNLLLNGLVQNADVIAQDNGNKIYKNQISGSNNILFGGSTSMIVVGTGSVMYPTTDSNIIGNSIYILFLTSSLAKPTYSKNINLRDVNIWHDSGSMNAQGNIINGSLTSQQIRTPGTVLPTLTNNIIHGGSVILAHQSSSILTTNNLLNGVTVNNNYYHTGSNNNVVFASNLIGGQITVINVAGNPQTNVARPIVGNLIGGSANTVSAQITGSDLGGLRNTAIWGYQLNVTGSHSTAQTTQQGAAFFGRWNSRDNGANDAARTVFAVGTGTSNTNRKTAFLIDSGSNVYISGSLNVTGGITGSLQGTATTASFATDFNKTGLITTGSVGNTQNITGSLIISSSLNVYDKINDLKIWTGSATLGSIGIGSNTLQSQSGSYPTFLGNIAIGGGALQTNVTGGSIVAIGGDALRDSVAGFNLAIGSAALQANTTGQYNIGIGQSAYQANTIGEKNTAIGWNSGVNNLTGSTNTIIGAQALSNNINGSGNIAIGHYAGYYSTGSNGFYIGNDNYGSLSDEQNKSLFYGEFNGTTANQSLRINANTKIIGDVMFSSGSNKTMGTVALDGGNPGSATVSNSLVTANSMIFLTKQTLVHTNGYVAVSSKGSGTFTITSNHNGDADTVAYQIINPA